MQNAGSFYAYAEFIDAISELAASKGITVVSHRIERFRDVLPSKARCIHLDPKVIVLYS